ncbi:MAG: DEAD/DEAH box helicase family protein [Proteobacteria bacterium]|nr:DEAD/DEAH box helicase family protein [Pseudomonadota bacterium]MBU1966648.1 DEAD/DEAH box helicase family protein [Pseudomonadota bacterium]MBU4371704.1 DEAD/DEAH box helicase family protein [Pseudomonadota bacterium]MBU4581888.1 DEAD/DEAH box helicase family protein [Pseudomonadota bacterium]MCG2741227.1 DEAD/DEAH box helicase family protein [Syntrophaceae bacterium]
MYYSFAPYEQDFRAWWASKAFPEVNPLTRDFLTHITRPDAPRRLWRHQEEAFMRTVYAYELLQWKDLLLNIVTGGGKTAIIGAVVAWLKVCHDIHKFLLLCPNTIVRDRLEDDFTDAMVFRDFGFFPPGTEHYTNALGLHVMQPGEGPQGIRDYGVILGNIHQLYQANISGKRNLAVLMNADERIAVFNDEAHNTPAAEYDSTLFTLRQISKFRLDTTATPDRADGQVPDTKMIFDYSITDAQAEVPPIIKNIVVYQPQLSSVELTYTNPETGEKRTVDEMDEEFERIEKGLSSTQWVTDPDPMHKQIRIALDRLAEQKRRADALAKGAYKPILFVVAITIKDAQQARDMLEEQFKLRTLLVTEQSDEKDREAARKLGKPGSPYEAVVSVLMLREGWDVPAVSVILLLRKFSSRVYGQQVVGRGLRLNVRDTDLQEICAIVDHEKLKHDWLWDIVGAKVRKDVEQATLFGDEDLPPKRKPQFVVNPDLLIPIPEPMEEEKADFDDDLANIRIETTDYPHWQKVLDEFDYGVETEISRVEISGVVGQTLDGSGFREIREAPALYGVKKPLSEIDDPIQLAELLKTSVRDVAANLLAEEGIGSHELGYLYGVLMDHVREKMLGGKTVGTAGVAELRHAINCRHRLAANFKNRPGLIASIVNYKQEAGHADQ